MSENNIREQGFALTETLLASIIIAGVFMSSMAAIQSVIRVKHEAQRMILASSEVENIVAILRSHHRAWGLEEYKDWTITRTPYFLSDTKKQPSDLGSIRLEQIQIVNTALPDFGVTFLLATKPEAE